MSKVAIFTLTRDRLDMTKATLASMRERRPGHAYDHWFFDQGSSDGTPGWLRQNAPMASIVELGENKGLHVAMNLAHEALLGAGYDFIMKVDNDIEFKTVHWLKKLLRAQALLAPGSILAPRVLNLRHPPEVFARKRIGDFTFSFLDIVGGAARLMPRASITDFRFNERMPLAWGGDATFANHCARNVIPMAYVEDVRVRHMLDDEEQEKVNPEYFQRRTFEAYIPYAL